MDETVMGRWVLSRRAFLRESARLALKAGVGAGVLSTMGCGGAAGPPNAPTAPSSTAAVIPNAKDSIFADLASRVAGPVLLPGNAGFTALAQPNNLRYASIVPMAIARCTGPHDVAQAVAWARQNGVPFVARAGGHNYAGFSTTSGLLIDVSLMNAIEFDPSSGLVTLGAGVINTPLYNALRQAGATITHGRCASVGVAGFLLGGGIGFNMRRLGVGCDLLVETQLVTADSQVLTLNETTNADLFWACRGAAGGNFGIHTSFTVQTVTVPPTLTVFRIRWTVQQAPVLTALMQALDAAPNALGSRVSVLPVTPQELADGQDVTVGVIGQLVGTPQDLAAILQPVYQVAVPSSQTIQQMAYWDGQAFLEEAGLPDRYQERSRFFGPLSDATIAVTLQQARQWPGSSEEAEIKFFQTGGQMNAVPPDATAFVHRDSHWLMSISVAWAAGESPSVIAANLQWQTAAYQALIAFTSGGAYQNFPDPSLLDWPQAYYQTNLARLEQVKQLIDSTMVFRFAQSIAPAAPVAQAGSSLHVVDGRSSRG